jgi:hypothetical protein
VASVLTKPAEMFAAEGEEQFNLDAEKFAGKKMRVRVHIDRVLVTPISRELLKSHPVLSSLTVLSFANATNFRVLQNQAEVLEKLIAEDESPIAPRDWVEETLVKGRPTREDTTPQVTLTRPTYLLSQLAQDTNIDESLLRTWIKAVERKGQAIFYGPPGTGKTFVAEQLARHLISDTDGFSELVQFHPSYAYEDFIQGIRPILGRNGGLDYSMVPGRFLEFCQKAQSRKGACVLIIDEINRSNLSRVFGELMYLLEYRERDVPLSGGGRLRVPGNVRIIGTMNTADRSIALVDHALRRRFAFISLRPDYEVLRRFHAGTGYNIDGLIATLKRLNSQINDQHYEIGITFFLISDLKDQIEAIWTMEIEPYLEEYFFDQSDTVDNFRWSRVSAAMS